jgi:transposase
MNQCGFDVGKKSSSYCIRDEKRAILQEGKVAMKPGALRTAFEGKAPMRFILEASSKSFWVADFLESMGHRAVVVDAARTKAIASARIKNDKMDARILGELGVIDFLCPVSRPTREQRLAKMKLRVRHGLVHQRSEMMMRIRSLVDSEGGELRAATAEAFTRMVRATPLPEGLAVLIEPLLRTIDALAVEVKKLDKEVEAWAEGDETARRLQTVPGVGPLVAAAFIAVVRDAGRFKRGASVASYLGLVPSLYESGQTSKKGRITHAGDSHLRWLLTLAANGLLRATKRDSRIRRWGLALVEKSGRKKAVVAVARKMAVVLWTLWRNGTTFEARLQEATA